MKYLKYWIFILVGFLFLVTACTDDLETVEQAGDPKMEFKSTFTNVHFGDNLPFTVSVSDSKPLSVLIAKLYFGDEVVQETTIRTKENGEYSGTIYVPFLKEIPDGTAYLEFTLRNVTMKTTSQTFEVPITRALYPYLILVTADASYPMLPTENPYEYAATEAFPSTDLPAYIKTPVMDEKGTEVIFGWEAGTVTQGEPTNIPFVSPKGGVYSVTFNTKTYEASPFFEITINGEKMPMVDGDNYQIVMDFKQNEEITLLGITDADWWIDVDFFEKEADYTYRFVPIDGKYRVTANLPLKYLKFEVMSGTSPATLQEDGTGAVWIIGDNVGKPSIADNEIGWTTEKAICMAPIESTKYQITLVAGQTVSTNAVNFKFFHQPGWGSEFNGTTLVSDSDIIYVNNGASDNGNLRLVDDKPLEEGATYVLTVDLSAGIENGILSVVKK